MIRVIIAFLVLSVSAAAAPYDQPHPSSCRIRVSYDNSGVYGSGTLIGKNETHGLVLTCWHLFRDRSPTVVLIMFPDGQHYGAAIKQLDPNNDLAMLLIFAPSAPSTGVGELREGTTYWCSGYGGGAWRAVSGHVEGYGLPQRAEFPSAYITGAVRPGDSGGGVYTHDGILVAVVWGTNGRSTAVTFGTPLLTFVAPYFAMRECSEWDVPMSSCPGGRCPVQPIPRNPNVRPITPAPPPGNGGVGTFGCPCGPKWEALEGRLGALGCDCQAKWDALEGRLKALEDKLAAVDNRPFNGAISDRISRLEARPQIEPGALARAIIASLPPINVRNVDANGNVISDTEVPLGGNLNLRVRAR